MNADNNAETYPLFDTEWVQSNEPKTVAGTLAPPSWEIFVSPNLPYRLVYIAFATTGANNTFWEAARLQFFLNGSLVLDYDIALLLSTSGGPTVATNNLHGKVNFPVRNGGTTAGEHNMFDAFLSNTGTQITNVRMSPLPVALTCDKIRIVLGTGGNPSTSEYYLLACKSSFHPFDM